MESGAPKIDRENDEDELDRGDCLTIGNEEKFENENEEGGDQEPDSKKRKYRRKEETQRIQSEVADRIRKKQEKEEEKIKFLKWKEEKTQKEKEQREREGVEYDERAKRN